MMNKALLITIMGFALLLSGAFVIGAVKQSYIAPITQAESLILSAKGYDNITATPLSCSTTVCDYEIFVNGNKMKVDPLPKGRIVEGNYTAYTDNELLTIQQEAITTFFKSESARLSTTETKTTKGQEQDIYLSQESKDAQVGGGK